MVFFFFFIYSLTGKCPKTTHRLAFDLSPFNEISKGDIFGLQNTLSEYEILPLGSIARKKNSMEIVGMKNLD